MEKHQPPASNGSKADHSDVSKLGDAAARVVEMVQQWTEWTPEQTAALNEQRDRDERRQRRENFEAFIGDRERYRNCTIDGFECMGFDNGSMRDVLGGVRTFIGDLSDNRARGTGALFYGPPGTGKDHLATCIVRAACFDHGHTAKYLNGIDWFGEIRDAMGDDRRTEKAMMSECARPDWLVLSDPLPPIGDLTVHQAGMLFRLMDARQSARKPTIVTVNVANGAEAIKRMGGATWDRMKADVVVFGCSWKSHRQPLSMFGSVS